jgi:Tfp pilus assembly PilM family ATPase
LSALKNDINSTEKLLNVIRGNDEETFSAFETQKVSLPEKKPPKKTNVISLNSFFKTKNHTVGVDVNREYICLVKTDNNSGGRPILVDKKIIKYSPQITNGTPEFKNLLKSSIIDFCGTPANCNIWTKISTSEVNVHFLKVPRVPKNKLENVIFWTAKKESFIDEENAIFDFEVQGEIVEQGNPKYSVMVYTASKAEIERIKSLFSDMEITLAGITTAPFAIQNIFRSKWMPVTEEVFASLYIGSNFSRIDVYNRDNLVMTRGIKTGSGNSMMEAIITSVYEKTGNLKLKHEEARKILLSLSPDSEKLKNTDPGHDFKREEILEMISPVWERLARQVDLTLKTSTIGNQKVEKIYIISSVNVDESMMDYMSDQLGTKTEFFDPFNKKRISGYAQESLSIPEIILLSPALGFSLSDNSYTPNVIFTYSEKNKETIAGRINRVIFLCFLAGLAACFILLIYQSSYLNNLKTERQKLEKELALYNPLLSRETIQGAADRVKMQKTMVHQYAQKYMGLAAMEEVSDLTPQQIRLISFRITQGNDASKTDASKAPNQAGDSVAIEGIIFDKKDHLESDLSKYLIKLEESPMFNSVTVQKKDITTFKKNEVLHFTLSAKTG